MVEAGAMGVSSLTLVQIVPSGRNNQERAPFQPSFAFCHWAFSLKPPPKPLPSLKGSSLNEVSNKKGPLGLSGCQFSPRRKLAPCEGSRLACPQDRASHVEFNRKVLYMGKVPLVQTGGLKGVLASRLAEIYLKEPKQTKQHSTVPTSPLGKRRSSFLPPTNAHGTYKESWKTMFLLTGPPNVRFHGFLGNPPNDE